MEIPNLNDPVSFAFGAADTPPPDWRAKAAELDADDDDAPASEEQRALIANCLGFDPFTPSEGN